MALFFDVKQLIDMSSIGTLMAYSIVAISVLILRLGLQFFRMRCQSEVITWWVTHFRYKIIASTSDQQSVKSPQKLKINLLCRILNWNGSKYPSKFSGNVAKWAVLLFSKHRFLLIENRYLWLNVVFFQGVMSFVCGLLIKLAIALFDDNFTGFIYTCVVICISGLITLFIVFVINRQPVQEAQLAFKVLF